MNLAVFGKDRQEKHFDALRHLFHLLELSGMTLFVEREFLDYLAGCGVRFHRTPGIWHPGVEADAALSIGGDGTFLRTARRLGTSGVPLVGVNTGHLGFLTHFTISESELLVNMLREGSAEVEERMLLKVEAPGMPADVWPYALNEVAITKEETSSMISVQMEVDGHYLADYLADGIVISTPTGSTAYNLAAGGPLLQPNLDCMVLTPIAPHTLTLRPLVVGGDSVLRVVTTSRATRYRVGLDGCGFPMECGSEIRVTRAPFGIPVLVRPGADFASALRHKLLWAQR